MAKNARKRRSEAVSRRAELLQENHEEWSHPSAVWMTRRRCQCFKEVNYSLLVQMLFLPRIYLYLLYSAILSMDFLLKGNFEPNKSIQIQHFQNKFTAVYLKSPHCFHTSSHSHQAPPFPWQRGELAFWPAFERGWCWGLVARGFAEVVVCLMRCDSSHKRQATWMWWFCVTDMLMYIIFIKYVCISLIQILLYCIIYMWTWRRLTASTA